MGKIGDLNFGKGRIDEDAIMSKVNSSGIIKKKTVTSIKVGTKIINGKNTGEPCIAVGVKKKILKSEINPKDLIPREFNGIKTDVVEEGEIKPLTLSYEQADNLLFTNKGTQWCGGNNTGSTGDPLVAIDVLELGTWGCGDRIFPHRPALGGISFGICLLRDNRYYEENAF